MVKTDKQEVDLISAYGDGWYDGFKNAEACYLKKIMDLDAYADEEVIKMSEEAESKQDKPGRQTGMKTVKDKDGRELQIGAVYEFSDDEKTWAAHTFAGVVGGHIPFAAFGCGDWCYIRECQAPLGTINSAPVKLSDNCLYWCEYDNAFGAFKYIGGKWLDSYTGVIQGEEQPKPFWELVRAEECTKS